MNDLFYEVEHHFLSYAIHWISFLLLFSLVSVLYAALSHIKLHKAQTQLYRSKKEMEGISKLAMTNPHPVIQINNQGHITFINPAALYIFPDISKRGKSHAVFEELEFSDLPAKGIERDFIYNKRIYHQSVFPTMKGRLETSVIVHCVDITSLKKTEKELQNSLKQAEKSRKIAEEAKKARGEFLANMSHELRTPINGIIGLSGLLMESEKDLHKKQLSEGIHYSATNLLGLLNDILDFSKIEAGELKFENRAFSPARILNDLAFLHRHTAHEKGIEFKTIIDGNFPNALSGDPLRLSQILNNLVSNAIKFTAQGHVLISLNAAIKEDRIYTLSFTVEDTGIGIPEDKQTLVFEKFRQADTTTARQYGGTGLGLTITKRLSDLMGGQLSLFSVLNKGTTIVFSVDLKIADEKDLQSSNDHNPVTLNPDATILIADDHPINLLFLRNVLLKAGLTRISEASNGYEAIERYKNSPFDIILMDCQMPEMDGFTAAELIRKHAKSINHNPFMLAVTADAMKGAIDKARQSGMEGYISKPIDKRVLLEILSQKVGNSASAHNSDKIDNNVHSPPPVEDKKVLDLPILNPSVLQDYSEGDINIERAMEKIFIENLYLDFSALEKSWADKNYRAWNDTAHKLYGACANFGAERLAAFCDTAQEMPLDQISEINLIHQEISKHYKDLINVLKQNQALNAA